MVKVYRRSGVQRTSINFYQTTRRNNPEDSHLHIRRRENLKYPTVLSWPGCAKSLLSYWLPGPRPIPTSFPIGPVKVLPWLTVSYISNRFHARSLLIALMMEAARTSKTLVNFYQTTRRYNPEDSHLRTLRRENLKSYLYQLVQYITITCSYNSQCRYCILSMGLSLLLMLLGKNRPRFECVLLCPRSRVVSIGRVFTLYEHHPTECHLLLRHFNFFFQPSSVILKLKWKSNLSV
jgi:hypothetical protein